MHLDTVTSSLKITGTSQAPCVVLMIDSSTGGFEAVISKDDQAREHVLRASNLGVKEMVCCCNKLNSSSMGKEKTRINIVVIGRVDSSTGNLIYNLGGTNKRVVQEGNPLRLTRCHSSTRGCLTRSSLGVRRCITISIALWKLEYTKY